MIVQTGKIYKRIKKITKVQKKILYLGLVAVVFLFNFWFFIYAPQAKKFSGIKKELSNTETQISEILKLAKGRDLAVAITELKNNLLEISQRLPAQEQTVIYHLAEAGKKLNLEVKNIIPSGRHLLADRISGYIVEELPVSLSLVAEFRALGEFLFRLRNNFPILVRIAQVEIRGKGEGRTDLEINLQICAYISREKQ